MSERLEHINSLLSALDRVWPSFVVELNALIEDKTTRLISENDEQTRGAIKALRELLDLPETLKSERDHMTEALPEQSDALL